MNSESKGQANGSGKSWGSPPSAAVGTERQPVPGHQLLSQKHTICGRKTPLKISVLCKLNGLQCTSEYQTARSSTQPTCLLRQALPSAGSTSAGRAARIAAGAKHSSCANVCFDADCNLHTECTRTPEQAGWYLAGGIVRNVKPQAARP